MADTATSPENNLSQDSEYPNQKYAWYCLSIICLAYVFGFIDRIIVGLITPAIQADIGLSDSQMGIIQGLAFALFYTLFGLPLGWAADRFNRKTLLTAGSGIWSLMTAAGGFVSSFAGLFGVRAGVGISEATLNPCAASLIGDYFKPRTRPKAFGVYTMSTAFGTVLTYLTGGAVIGFVMANSADGSTFALPVIGDVKAWQAVFIIVGLGGIIPTLLLAFTVREPKRLNISSKVGGTTPISETIAFIKANKMTLFCHNAGVALVFLAVYGWINWMPSFFSRIHDWGPAQFAVTYGVFGGAAGIFSAVSSGYVSNWFKDKGYSDGVMRCVLVGCVGTTVGSTIAPLMPTPGTAIAVFAITGLVVNYPPAQALMAINEITPNQFRGQVTAIYILVLGLLAAGLGPFVMGWVTDNVFGDPQKIHYSMALVSGVSGTLGTFLICRSLKAYRISLSRVDWT